MPPLPPPRSSAVEGAEHGPLGTEEYRLATLTTNNIFLADAQMDPWVWFQTSLSLGINRLPADYSLNAFEKVAKQVRKESGPNVLEKSVVKALFPDQDPDTVIVRVDGKSFAEGAIWQRVKSEEVMPGWKTRLPIPRPTFTYGYRESAFPPSAIVVQWNIAPYKEGTIARLSDAFRPIQGLFWPFLVVEARDAGLPEGSVLPAKHAAAGTAASCVTGARAIIDTFREQGNNGPAGVPAGNCYDAARVFSVTIGGKQAVLSMHTFDEDEQYTMTEIQTFDLPDAADLRQLRAQIDGILSWAMESRLPLILRLLNWFGRSLQART